MENKTMTPNPRSCAMLREDLRIKSHDPDVVGSLAKTRIQTMRAEKVFEEEGYLITREMISFEADRILIWGDRDYDDPPLESADAYLERERDHWAEHRARKREIWKVKQDATPTYPKIKGKVLNGLSSTCRAMVMKCGLLPDLNRLFTKVIFFNLDGSVHTRNREGTESLAQVRRKYLLHHGWDGDGPEPEWAAEVRVSDVQFLERKTGPKGRCWIVARIPSPHEKLSSFVDPFPGLGDDGAYRWVGAGLVFDRSGQLLPYMPGGRRLSLAEFETAIVQGAQIEDDPIENELVGGPPVTLSLDEGLNWDPIPDDVPFDRRERGAWNRARIHESGLSHDLQLFYDTLKDLGETDLADSMLNGPATHHRFNLVKTARGLIIEHLDPEPQVAPWENDPDLKIAILKALGPVLAAEYHSYL